MITVKDFNKAANKPNACKDALGRLRVGAAIGAGAGNEDALVPQSRPVLTPSQYIILMNLSQGVLDSYCLLT